VTDNRHKSQNEKQHHKENGELVQPSALSGVYGRDRPLRYDSYPEYN
jgi:hypothetical protein